MKIRQSLREMLILMRKTAHAYQLLGFGGAVRKILRFIQKQGWCGLLIKMVNGGYLHGWFGYVAHDPFVSIVAVNFNGAEHLPAFLESLRQQCYRKFEVIIVDNGSRDNSENVVNTYTPTFPQEIKFLKCEKNLGFAEGNNLALDFVKGEFLALLNVDAKVHEDWLRELVEAIRYDGSAAVAAPKILFWSRFQDLEICSDQTIALDLTALGKSLRYGKFFVRTGLIHEGRVESASDKKIVLSLPVQKEPIALRISTQALPVGCVEFRTPTTSLCRIALAKSMSVDLAFSLDSIGNAGYLINNAGSIADAEGMPCDRGFAEYDRGQYDEKCYIPYFCGCAALIRRAAILTRTLFIPELFAYYEDSELSRWITSSGFKILYAPRSVVFHRHSATLTEESPTWRYLVQRSRAIFNYSGIVEVLLKELQAAKAQYQNAVDPELMSILENYDQCLIQRLQAGEDLVKGRKAIGIYNSYWNTRGGGESHALSIAAELQQLNPIEIISESDFDLDRLGKYFGIDLSRCRKLVLPKLDESWTGRFFLFINSTFCSNLSSRAPHSWYLVSFPHRFASKKMLKSYFFLFNSEYSAKWAKRYWGNNIRGIIIHPIRMLRTSIGGRTGISQYGKKKIILSVGRFNPFGHSKNQLEIAQVYRSLVMEMPEIGQWKLILAGSLDYDQSEHVAYFESVNQCLEGLNYELFPNLEKACLDGLFSEAALYIQATGMGFIKEREPEKFEHFGITPIQAMQNGCIPVVFDTGGPAEIVRQLGVGYCFSSAESLQVIVKNLIQKDFSILINESRTVQKRGSDFVNAESGKSLPIQAFVNDFTQVEDRKNVK
jgi:GT2 family glycosyltransferase/glycosyltransferase involved in cell wall biosynthesis